MTNAADRLPAIRAGTCGVRHMGSSNRSDHPTNVYDMMERLDLERAGGVVPRLGLIYASAVHACHHCEHGDACRDWLEAASPALNAAPAFCPNADLLSELIFDQPSSWRTNMYARPH